MGEIFERRLPEIPLEWTGERLTTGTSGQVEIEHLHRYFLARELCRGLDVLDVASGEGYGAALLAQVARSVTGVEISPAAVAYANQAYGGAALRFLEGDARRLPIDDASVDAVVSFETIEHFYEHEQFLAEVRRVLRPDGHFIVSSPERDIYSPTGSAANPYHVRELSHDEFSALLRGAFTHVHMFGQRPILGSVLLPAESDPRRTLTFERRGRAHFESSEGLPRAVYYVAVASNTPMPKVPASIYIDTDEVGQTLAAAQAATAAAAELRSMRERVEAAEAAHAAARAELMLSIEQASEQAASFREQLRIAGEMAAEHAADAAFARTEATAASMQRDIARAASRRATVVAEHHWHKRLEELGKRVAAAEERATAAEERTAAAGEQATAAAERAALAEERATTAEDRAAAADQRAAMAEQRASTATQRALVAEEQAAAWQANYEGLRARLQKLLERFGILQAARLTPKSMRHFARKQLLGWGRR